MANLGIAFGLTCDRSLYRHVIALAPKDEFTRADINSFSLIACFKPGLRHYVVRWIVAPPSAVMLCLWRKFGTDNSLDFSEGKQNFVAPLFAEKRAQRFVFAHDRRLR